MLFVKLLNKIIYCKDVFLKAENEYTKNLNTKITLKNKIKGFLEYRYSEYKIVNYLVKHKFPNALKAANFR